MYTDNPSITPDSQHIIFILLTCVSGHLQHHLLPFSGHHHCEVSCQQLSFDTPVYQATSHHQHKIPVLYIQWIEEQHLYEIPPRVLL